MTTADERITTAVNRRDEQQAGPSPRQIASGKLREYQEWFKRILPPQMPADAFLTLLFGVLRKDPELAEAAMMNPDGMLIAATDCAQQGGVPGKTYHFTHFRNRETGVEDIVGIADYKLEIAQAYNSGQVAAVKYECVYKGPIGGDDYFKWAPTRMAVPEHEVVNTLQPDDELFAAYAYAELMNGRISKCVVMFRPELMKHRAAARTKKVWDAWFKSMCLKTTIHQVRKSIPQSAAAQTEVIRAYADVEKMGGRVIEQPGEPSVIVPPPVPPALGNGDGEPAGNTLRAVAEEEAPWPPGTVSAPAEPVPPSPGPAGPVSRETGDGTGEPDAAAYAAHAQAEEDTAKKMTRQTGGRISRMFQDIGWIGDDYAHRRLIIAGYLVNPRAHPTIQLASPMAMTETMGLAAEANLSDVLSKAARMDPPRDPAEVLQAVYDQLTGAGATTEDPPGEPDEWAGA